MAAASGEPGERAARVVLPASGSGGGEDAGGPEGGPLRADARRNRAHILAAADAVFGEQGVGVPVDEVARRAGVGVGTLYRHFPTKEKLFEAVIITHLEALVARARAMGDAADPGEALFEFLGLMADEATHKRDLVDALSGAGVNVKDVASRAKDELERAVGVLLARAQDAGTVRPDVSLPDLIGLVMGTCMAAEVGSTGRSRARMLEIVCAGLRAVDVPGRPAAASRAPGVRR